MKVSKTVVKEISDELQIGMVCFVHIKTGNIEAYPKDIEAHDDQFEFWNEIIKKVQRDIDNYVKLDGMPPSDSFAVMESFTKTIQDQNLQAQLLDILAKPKPFSNWKNIVERSFEQRENWFKFKTDKYENWVEKQLSV